MQSRHDDDEREYERRHESREAVNVRVSQKTTLKQTCTAKRTLEELESRPVVSHDIAAHLAAFVA
jgi:hypothetical protein